MDSKEGTSKGKLVRGLSQLVTKGQEMHFIGKNQIDGIWATKEIDCHMARLLHYDQEYYITDLAC